jgi:predicted glycoside hydrolase/deacetylase ChbG (UPF0249 family)
VNADDFGLSCGVNRGIVVAHERGIVTTTSLMVRARAANEAAEYARSHPSLGVGLHVDIAERKYEDDGWVLVYSHADEDDDAALLTEVRSQLDRFRQLVGRDPTHLDSHQHVHRKEPLRSIMVELSRELDVALRGFTEGVTTYSGFYGQTDRGEPAPECITRESLDCLLRALPDGLSELSCHPGWGSDSGSSYAEERALELQVLCDPEIAAVIHAQGIILTGFGAESQGRRVGLGNAR